MKEEAMNMKESKEGYLGEFGEKKGKREMVNYFIISKTKGKM